MFCPSCKHEDRAGRKFCVHCGAGLELCCPSCGASTEPGERFCGEHGELPAEPAKPRPPPDPLSYTPKHLAEPREAHRLFVEIGAPIRADHVTKELAR